MTDQSIRRRTAADIRMLLASVVRDIADRPQGAAIEDAWELGAGCGFDTKRPKQTEHLGLDAIDHVEILCAAETILCINISDAAGNRINTFGELVEHAIELCGIAEGATA